MIHSFWIPRLGGKLDIIPNDDHVLWLKADGPDTFSGECAEYCGLDHANMKMTVHADSQADFDAWIAAQLAIANATPAPKPSPSASVAPTPTATPVPTGS